VQASGRLLLKLISALAKPPSDRAPARDHHNDPAIRNLNNDEIANANNVFRCVSAPAWLRWDPHRVFSIVRFLFFLTAGLFADKAGRRAFDRARSWKVIDHLHSISPNRPCSLHCSIASYY
jgi:hypothetical protein